jgi:hypothetical protein
MCQAMPRRFILALLLAALLPLLAYPQRRGGSGGHSARSTPGFLGRHHSVIPTGYFLGDTPFFYNDYPFDQAMPEYAAQQPVIMRAAADAPSETRPAPLLIELQGDRYVRYGGIQSPSQRAMPAAEIRPETAADAGAQTQTAADLTPTVLIYRDGHREEIPDYAIVGRVIYAHTNRDRDTEGDYGTTNIQLSALDIPATMRANRENGVRFVLPAGPNEVVTRP